MRNLMRAYVLDTSDALELQRTYPDSVFLYNPTYVLSKEQALFAAAVACRACATGQSLAKKLAVEFLIRLSGERKIAQAVTFGPAGLGEVAGVIFLDDRIDLSGLSERACVPSPQTVAEKYGVDVADLQNAVYEKMALVAL